MKKNKNNAFYCQIHKSHKNCTSNSIFLSDSTGEIRAKVRIGQISDLDGSHMDGTHYPRYLQAQVGFGL